MNDAIFDIQNMRKSILNCTMNIRVENDTDRLFVKSLCGVMGILADFETLYLGKKFSLIDDETLAANLETVRGRISSMFSAPGSNDAGDMDISAVEDDGLVTLTVKFPVGLRDDLVVEHFKKALREGGC